jgi:methyltransferase (TIGR00027 family)
MSVDTTPDGSQLTAVADTARWTAAARARESRRADRLFADPLAERLAGPHGEKLLRHFHPEHAADEGNPFLPIRTRWFDDYLAANLTGGGQVVGLGAGLDTRAFRLAWPAGTVLFEVDQPAVLSYKETQLAGSGARPRCDCRTVPVDLGDDWGAALLGAGYHPDRPAVWFAEGLLFYLPEQFAGQVVQRAAELSAPGSRLAADLIGTGIFRFRYLRSFLRKLEQAGSPWVFGTDQPDGFLAEHGWTPYQLVEPGEPGANYGRWPEAAARMNLPDLPRSYLVAATRTG